jgi:hypothetical protein
MALRRASSLNRTAIVCAISGSFLKWNQATFCPRASCSNTLSHTVRVCLEHRWRFHDGDAGAFFRRLSARIGKVLAAGRIDTGRELEQRCGGCNYVRSSAPASASYPMLWNIVVILTIIVAFGVTLVALGTDPQRRPME